MELRDLPLNHRRPGLQHGDEAALQASGSETPLTALVNSLLHPLIATATLVVCVYVSGAQFTGHYLLLAVLALRRSSGSNRARAKSVMR